MDIMGMDNKWLLFDTAEECVALIARINIAKVEAGDIAIARGTPIELNNGKYAQCVDDLADFLTQAEVSECVKDSTFISLILT